MPNIESHAKNEAIPKEMVNDEGQKWRKIKNAKNPTKKIIIIIEENSAKNGHFFF